MKILEKGMTSLMAYALILFLCGCNGGTAFTQSESGSVSMQESEKIQFLSEEELNWSDNTLDDLHAVLNVTVSPLKAEGELNGGRTGIVIGDGGCVIYKTHLFEQEETWSGVNGITMWGNEFAYPIDLKSDGNEKYIDIIGLKAGSDRYVAGRKTNEEGVGVVYQLYELDESFQLLRSARTELLSSETEPYLNEVAGDADGRFHVTYFGQDGKERYAIISSKGEVLFDVRRENKLSLCTIDKGRVVLCETTQRIANNEWWFYEADLGKGELRELAASADDGVRKKMKGNVMCAVPIDEYKLAWCTNEGLVLCDVKNGDVRLAYKWSNHGIAVPFVLRIAKASDGSIGILYQEKEKRFLLLEATDEKTEIKSIILATSRDNKDAYLTIAAYFNKKYPAYNITVMDGWDETSLLTQLGAGDGPVLVDTALTGFEDLEKLWQPLDSFLEQTGLREDLIPETLSFGKIGETQYGIVKDFTIETLVTSQAGPTDWDYGGFLNVLEKTGEMAPFSYEKLSIPYDFRSEYFEALCNGVDDTYYLNMEQGSTIFGTEEFDRVLKLSEQARKCPPAEGGKAIHDGKAISEHVELLSVQGIVELRMRMETNGDKLIGYPTKNGARHLLVAGAPLTMRVTATEEEKKIAYTFLQLLLSKEGQTSSVRHTFFVRHDALEEQFASYEYTVEMLGDQFHIPPLDREKDMPLLYELILKSTPQKSLPTSLKKVLDEEFGDYLSGRIDGNALSEHLKSRVMLYLQESK